MQLNAKQQQLSTGNPWDFSDLRALFLNCTLKRSPELSHTEGLMQISRTIMEKTGVATELLRPLDHAIAQGVYPDMTEHGWETDAWPALFEKREYAWCRKPTNCRCGSRGIRTKPARRTGTKGRVALPG